MPMIRKRYWLQWRNDWVRVARNFRRSILCFIVGGPGCRRWSRFQGRVVTGPRADGQAFTIRSPGLHFYDPIGPVLLSIHGYIGDGVLGTDITCDSFTKGDNFP